MPSIPIEANLSAGSLGDLVRSVQDALGQVEFDALRDAGAENLIADLERLQFQLRGTEQEMSRVAGVAEQLDGGVDLTIDSNADETAAELEQVDAALDELTGTSADITIDADTEETLAELAELDAALDTIDGEDITASVEISGTEGAAESLISIDEAAASLADSLGNRLPGPLGNVVGLIGQVSPVAAAAAAALGGLLVVGEQFAGASRDISVATGATGAALDDLNGSFETVLSTASAADFGDTSAQIGILNTFLGSTGPELESLAVQLQDVNRLLGEDVVQNSEDFAQVLNLFGVSAADGATQLDALFVATQKYGIGLGPLLTQLETSGSLFSSFDLSLTQSADLIGQFNRAGLQASQAGQALQQFIRGVSEDSGDLTTSLGDVQREILGATTDTEAFTIATEAFGARGGVQFATAIRSGIIDLETLGVSLEGAEGSIQRFAAENELAAETVASAWNDILVTLEPVGTGLRGLFTEVLGGVGAILEEDASQVDALTTAFNKLGEAIGLIQPPLPTEIELPDVTRAQLRISRALDALPKYVVDVLPEVKTEDLQISQTLDALPKFNVNVGADFDIDEFQLRERAAAAGNSVAVQVMIELAADQAALENEIAAFIDPLEATILANFDVDTNTFNAEQFIADRTAELQAAAELEEITLEVAAELPEDAADAVFSLLGEVAEEYGPEAAVSFWGSFAEGGDPSEFLTDPLIDAFDGAATPAGELLAEAAQRSLDAGLEAEVDFIEGQLPVLDAVSLSIEPQLGPIPAFPTTPTPFPVVPEFGQFSPNFAPINVPVNPVLGQINPVTDAIAFPVVPEFGPFPDPPPIGIDVNPNMGPIPPYDPTDIEVNPYGYELPPYPPETVEVTPLVDVGAIQAALDGSFLSVNVDLNYDLPNVEGGAFNLAGVRQFGEGAFVDPFGLPQFLDGGFVGHNPGPGVLVPLGGGKLGIMGESYRGPEAIEYGPTGAAIVGGYHHAQQSRDRLDSAGVWPGLLNGPAKHELALQGWRPPQDGAGGPDIGIMAQKFDEQSRQMAELTKEVVALKRSNHRLEDSAKTSALANVETSGNTKGSRFSTRRGRVRV